MIKYLIHVGFELTPSHDSRVVLKSSFFPRAPKPTLGITLEFLSSYDETFFIGVPHDLKVVLKCLNPSQIDGSIQTKTIKVRRFSDYLLHFSYLMWKVFLKILSRSLNMVISSMVCKTKTKRFGGTKGNMV